MRTFIFHRSALLRSCTIVISTFHSSLVLFTYLQKEICRGKSSQKGLKMKYLAAWFVDTWFNWGI
jgi:hypothetical protein